MTDAVHVSSKGVQTYVTPPPFVNLCAQRFGADIVLDLAADSENARRIWFYDERVDSLKQNWQRGVVEAANAVGENTMNAAAWLNPPFRKTPAFMKKCAEESAKGCRIITLTLASIGTQWYKKWVKPNALSLILEDRITFEDQEDPFPKELMVSLWGFGMTGLGWWAWKKTEGL